MIIFLYNLLLLVCSPFLAIWLVIRLVNGKGRKGWFARLGFLPKHPETDEELIWVHAVSVGEVIAAQPLLKVIRQNKPDAKIMITCLTDSGYTTALPLIGKLVDTVSQLPIDLWPCVSLAIKRVRPSVLILMETEIWPNLLTCAHGYGVPIMIANGRISDKSLPRYKSFKPLIADALSKVDIICTQSEKDAERYVSIGSPKQHVRTTGNTKFDGAAGNLDIDIADFRKQLGLPETGPVVVIGSTRAAEEEQIVGDAYLRLTQQYPDLCIVWAPRHLERKCDVAATLASNGFTPWMRSDGTPDQPKQQIILDTFGELAKVYAVGDAAVIGGSFVPLGGQNLLQALAYGLPVVHGPYMQNFRDIAAICMTNGLSVTAKDADELVQALTRILSDDALRASIKLKAQEVIAQNAGASQRLYDAMTAMMSRSR